MNPPAKSKSPISKKASRSPYPAFPAHPTPCSRHWTQFHGMKNLPRLSHTRVLRRRRERPPLHGNTQWGPAELLWQSPRTNPQTEIKFGHSYFLPSRLVSSRACWKGAECLPGREEPCTGGKQLWDEVLPKAALIQRHRGPRPPKAWSG